MTVIVVAQYRCREGSADTVAEVLARHSAASEAEPGCLRFIAHQSLDDPTRFVLYEEYVDEAAFTAHRETEHFAANIDGIVAPLLVERTWERLRSLTP